MIDPQFLTILRCPETRQPLDLASADLLARVNARVRDGKLIKRGGDVATETLSEGLVREDGLVLYPVYDDIPDLLVEESFELKDL